MACRLLTTSRMAAHHKNWPTPDGIKATLQQFENVVMEAENVRGYVERQLRSRAFYPDRRHPKRWSGDIPNRREEKVE